MIMNCIELGFAKLLDIMKYVIFDNPLISGDYGTTVFFVYIFVLLIVGMIIFMNIVWIISPPKNPLEGIIPIKKKIRACNEMVELNDSPTCIFNITDPTSRSLKDFYNNNLKQKISFDGVERVQNKYIFTLNLNDNQIVPLNNIIRAVWNDITLNCEEFKEGYFLSNEYKEKYTNTKVPADWYGEIFIDETMAITTFSLVNHLVKLYNDNKCLNRYMKIGDFIKTYYFIENNSDNLNNLGIILTIIDLLKIQKKHNVSNLDLLKI